MAPHDTKYIPKVGDKVRLLSSPFCGIGVGQVCTITRVNQYGNFSVKESDATFANSFPCGLAHWEPVAPSKEPQGFVVGFEDSPNEHIIIFLKPGQDLTQAVEEALKDVGLNLNDEDIVVYRLGEKATITPPKITFEED